MHDMGDKENAGPRKAAKMGKPEDEKPRMPLQNITNDGTGNVKVLHFHGCNFGSIAAF